MNTADIAEDALLAVSAMQRTILDRGIAMCYYTLDNTGDTTMTQGTLNDLYNQVEAENAAKPTPAPTPTAVLEAKMRTFQEQLDAPRYHAWTTNLHTGEVVETDLDDDQVMDMVELDPVDVDAAIEEAGWCGALGATYGFPFVICPIGTDECPPDGVAFMRAQLVAKG